MVVWTQVFIALWIGSQIVLGDCSWRFSARNGGKNDKSSCSWRFSATARDGKSLVNSSPFNKNKQNPGEHLPILRTKQGTVNTATADTIRDAKQGAAQLGSGVGFVEIASVRPGSDGKRCIDKVEVVTETEYDEVVLCEHSYDKRCHTSYVTNYDPQQEEECEENFKKICHIQFEVIAFNETVNICRTPLVKDCNIQSGQPICRTEYESECWTKQEEHGVVDDVPECRTDFESKCASDTPGYTNSQECSKWPKEVCTISRKNVKKYTPITGCTKEPIELCAPAGCSLVPGLPECYDKVVTVVQDAPNEECTLEPQRTCKFVTKLVPKLEPTEVCVDVPKEVCTQSKTKPRKVQKPVIKKWCYILSQESGLA